MGMGNGAELKFFHVQKTFVFLFSLGANFPSEKKFLFLMVNVPLF